MSASNSSVGYATDESGDIRRIVSQRIAVIVRKCNYCGVLRSFNLSSHGDFRCERCGGCDWDLAGGWVAQ